MRLESLELYQFRNRENASLRFESPIQFFVGPNAQGKTNLAEAVYVLATARSFRRQSQNKDLIRHGETEAAVRGEVSRDGLRTKLEVRLGKQRRLRVNGNDVKLLREYVSNLRAVAFHPEDLTIVRGGPDVRRDFIDRAAFTLYPDYLDRYARYQRALSERNALFKAGAARLEIEAWTEEVAVTGADLLVARKRFLDEFLPVATESFGEIFGATPVKLDYAPNPKELASLPISEWRSAYRSSLEEREIDDRERGFTTVGPHRDDLNVELDGKDARTYASQGQTRALALALRVAQVKHAGEDLGEAPVFILDDVGSELDEKRRTYLAEFLKKSSVQAFITATDRGLLPQLGDEGETWLLQDGRIERG